MNPSKKTALKKVANATPPFLPKDAMRDKSSSSRPTTPPAQSNSNCVVVETDASAVSAKSSSPSSSQVPVKVGANSWTNKKYTRNKARISEPDRPNTFRPSSSPSPSLYPTLPSQNYYDPYIMPPPPPICYYVPTLPQIQYSPFAARPFPVMMGYNNYNIKLPPTCIYTPTLDFPSSTLPLPVLTGLRHAITNQIEYYFSDDNLAKDPYLRSNMDSEGWVPVSLIAGFNEVINLTSHISNNSKPDPPFVRDSLIYSTTVEVQGEKVRRRDNWEKWLLKFQGLKQRKED